MRKTVVGLFVTLALLAPISAATVAEAGRCPRPRGGVCHARRHPIPKPVECVDIGFNEDGTPIIECGIECVDLGFDEDGNPIVECD